MSDEQSQGSTFAERVEQKTFRQLVEERARRDWVKLKQPSDLEHARVSIIMEWAAANQGAMEALVCGDGAVVKLTDRPTNGKHGAYINALQGRISIDHVRLDTPQERSDG